MRRGRGARVGFLAPVAGAARGTTVRAAAGEGWQAEAMLDRLGMAGLADTPDERAVGRAGEADRARRPARATSTTCSSSTSPPTTSTSTRSPSSRNGSPRSPAASLLVTHDRHVLDRVTTKVLELDRGSGYLHVPAGRARRIGLRGLPRGAHRARRAGRDGRADPARAGTTRAGVAATRRAGAVVASRRRASPPPRAIVEGRPQARPEPATSASRLGTARLGSKAIELHGVGFSWPRCERAAAAPVRPPARAGRPGRRRRAERFGQVDAARPDRRTPAPRPSGASSGARRCASATTTSSGATSIRRSGCATQSPARRRRSRRSRTSG